MSPPSALLSVVDCDPLEDIYLGTVIPPGVVWALVRTRSRAQPYQHRNASNHTDNARDEEVDTRAPAIHLECIRLPSLWTLDPRKAAADVLQTVAVARQTVQPHALLGCNENGKERKDETAVQARTDDPGSVATIGEDILP